jgi:hypothetical protein
MDENKLPYDYKVSPHGLALMRDCKFCFYLCYHFQDTDRVFRPSIPVASITNGVDELVKDLLTDARNGDTPEFLEFLEQHDLRPYENQSDLDRWRKKPDTQDEGLWYIDDRIAMRGAIDDLFVRDGKIVIMDTKTHKLFESKQKMQKHANRWYELQLSCYSMMIQKLGRKVDPVGYALVYQPHRTNARGEVILKPDLVSISLNPDRAEKMFIQSGEVLRGSFPKSSSKCDPCNYIKDRFMRTLDPQDPHKFLLSCNPNFHGDVKFCKKPNRVYVFLDRAVILGSKSAYVVDPRKVGSYESRSENTVSKDLGVMSIAYGSTAKEKQDFYRAVASSIYRATWKP